MGEHELTIEQAREVARMRRLHPTAEIRAHERPWGVILEVRRGGRTVALRRLDFGDPGIAPAPLAA